MSFTGPGMKDDEGRFMDLLGERFLYFTPDKLPECCLSLERRGAIYMEWRGLPQEPPYIMVYSREWAER